MNRAILRKIRSVFALLCLTAFSASATAQWVTHPALQTDDGRKPISLQFRRDVHFTRVPPRVVVRISADNRYVLFVNGQRVDSGPARGDLAHWRYRSLDIAPFLHSGKNVVAAQVWNDGTNAAMAQISAKSGFYLVAEDPSIGKSIDTGPAWRVRIDPSAQ